MKNPPVIPMTFFADLSILYLVEQGIDVTLKRTNRRLYDTARKATKHLRRIMTTSNLQQLFRGITSARSRSTAINTSVIIWADMAKSLMAMYPSNNTWVSVFEVYFLIRIFGRINMDMIRSRKIKNWNNLWKARFSLTKFSFLMTT